MSNDKKRAAILALLGAVAILGCGSEGPAGPIGPAGSDGAPGAKGDPGTDGEDGEPGADGLPGGAGAPGSDGTPGVDGQDGEDGEDAVLPPRELDATLPWYGTNRETLQAMIDAVGDPAAAPVAIFDWDNTVIKNDIGDAVTFFMLRNGLVRQPASWASTSGQLSAAAIASLDAYCPLSAAGAPLDTTSSPAGQACADAILCVYYAGKVWDGSCTAGAAFDAPETPATPKTIEPAYAWTVSLQAGHTPDAVRSIASAAIEYANYASLGETQTVGTGQYPRFVRVYDQIEDLIGTMKARGFDVWVVSASSQYIVEPFAERVGVPTDRVIGVRAMVIGGVLQPTFEGCGDHADGNHTLINYREGKRCWINKLVFPATYVGTAADLTRPSPTAFGAGDSITDLEFLLDASAMKLVVNRQKTELMCHAYYDDGGAGKWLVNPMFIEPKGKKSGGYDCGPYGIPDQEDEVYGY